MTKLAFGPAAERWLSAYQTQRVTLAVEPEGAVSAYEAAIRLRGGGQSFDLVLFWPNRRTHVAIAVAAQSMVDFPDYDERRFALEAIAKGEGQIKGHKIETLLAVDIATMTAMRDLIMLADRLIVRSWTEWRRIVFEMGLIVENVEVVDVPDRSVPPVERLQQDGTVVVWAPFTTLPKLCIIAMALQELHRRVIFICGDGSIDGIDIERVPLADAAPALARASAVVVADNDDPAPARALARLGIPLCATTTSGVREYLAGVQTFRPWHRKSVLAAVLAALGSAPPKERERAAASDGRIARQPIVVETAPLVSIVVRTHDRPLFLERALRSVAEQSYPHIETIVVNDAGPDVSGIVGRFLGARLIVQPQNDYRRVSNAGMREANGVYVARLDDDDIYFSDHVASLVDALEQSRESVAFADAVVAYVEGAESLVTGYLVVEKEPLRLSRMLGVNQLVAPMLRMLMRKETLERVGWFSESMYTSDDYELCLRLLRECDFVHVDRVTTMYTQFGDGSNLSASKDHRRADAHRLIHALYPVGDRPRLVELRRDVMERLERDGNLGMRRPPWRFPQPVPLPGYVAEEPSRLTT